MSARRAKTREEQERQGRSDQYSSIARSLKTAGGYGQHQDITYLMGEYDPDELAPPQDAWTLELPNLRHAAHFIAELIRWQEAKQEAERRKAHDVAVADARALIASVDSDAAA